MARDVRQLREEASEAAAAGKHKRALAAYLELEQLEPRDAQWSKRAAETYRRLGKDKDAIDAFARAADRYAQSGFLVQAIAVCKLILQIDPQQRRRASPARAMNEQIGAGPTRAVAHRREQPDARRERGGRRAPRRTRVATRRRSRIATRRRAPPPRRRTRHARARDADRAPRHAARATPTRRARRRLDAAADRDRRARRASRSRCRPISAIETISLKDEVPDVVRARGELRRLRDPDRRAIERSRRRRDERREPSTHGRSRARRRPPIEIEDPTTTLEVESTTHRARARATSRRFRSPSRALVGCGAPPTRSPRRRCSPGCRSEALEALVEQLHARARSTPDEVLFHEGDPGDALYVIVEGEVAVQAEGPPRVEMARLGPGSFIGEVALMTDQPRSATVTAVADAELLRIDRKTLSTRARRRTARCCAPCCGSCAIASSIAGRARARCSARSTTAQRARARRRASSSSRSTPARTLLARRQAPRRSLHRARRHVRRAARRRAARDARPGRADRRDRAALGRRVQERRRRAAARASRCACPRPTSAS